MNKKKILFSILILVTALLVFKQVMALKGKEFSVTPVSEIFSGKNEALLKIEGMTCGSCVEKIKEALSIPGKTEKVYVSLAKESASVLFIPSKISALELAAAVSKAGNYSASIVKIKDEKKLTEEAVKRKEFSSTCSLEVNGERITNEEFNTKLDDIINVVKKQYKLSALTPEQRLAIVEQVSDEMITDMIISDVLEKEKTEVSDSEIDQEIGNILKQYNLTMDKLQETLKNEGKELSEFRNEIRKSVMLEKFLNNKVFPEDTPEGKKGDLYSAWLTEIEDAAEIEIYNPEILQSRENSSGKSGCGGSCCSKS